jgi:hypothetical protein
MLLPFAGAKPAKVPARWSSAFGEFALPGSPTDDGRRFARPVALSSDSLAETENRKRVSPDQGRFDPVEAVLKVGVLAEEDGQLDALGAGDVEADGAVEFARGDVLLREAELAVYADPLA